MEQPSGHSFQVPQRKETQNPLCRPGHKLGVVQLVPGPSLIRWLLATVATEQMRCGWSKQNEIYSKCEIHTRLQKTAPKKVKHLNKWPPTNERTDKICFIHTVEYDLDFKRN